MAKKKKRKIRYDRVVLLVGIVVFILVSITLIVKKTNEENTSFDKKAVWISYLNMDTLKDKEEEEFIENFTLICEHSVANKLDTLIVQVRPFMDAIYDSTLFPISKSISSTSNMKYDALELMVRIAHEHQLKLEAWINPYRISYNDVQLNNFINNSDKAKWIGSEHILIDGSTAILNPASEKARTYIVDGVKEIIDNYNVDGIHMDDYFYVTSLFNGTTKEERCENVNLLVKQIYQTVKNKNSNLTFGISPQGNLDNARNIGADIDTWLSEDGYVDYVMPQIYWTDHWAADGSVNMFSTRVAAYNEIHTNKKVKIYAGLALYLAGQDVSDDAGWGMYSDNLKRQVEILKANDWNGYSLFDYDSLQDSQTQKEREQLIN